jgi:hypothetical protein
MAHAQKCTNALQVLPYAIQTKPNADVEKINRVTQGFFSKKMLTITNSSISTPESMYR